MKFTRRASVVAFASVLTLGTVPAFAQADLDTSEPVTLTVAGVAGSQRAHFEWGMESFQEKYPNVSIEVVDYEVDWYNQNAIRLFASSDSPDMAFFWLTGFYHRLVDAGVLQPLDDFYAEAGLYDILPQSSLEVATAIDGVKYGVPYSSIMSPLLMYNKEAFAAAGIESEPATIDELIAAGPALKEAGYIPWTSGLASASQATQLFDINIRRHTSDETYAKLISKEIMDYTDPEIVRRLKPCSAWRRN